MAKPKAVDLPASTLTSAKGTTSAAAAVESLPAIYPHELPRHLHQASGVYRLVTTAEECEAALASGWCLRPPVEGV